MTAHNNSLVVIVHEDDRADLEAMADAMAKHIELSNRLSATGQEPATHFGLHTMVTDGFAAFMLGSIVLEVPGHTEQEVAELLAKLQITVNFEGLQERPHFDRAVEVAGLQEIEPPDDD